MIKILHVGVSLGNFVFDKRLRILISSTCVGLGEVSDTMLPGKSSKLQVI